MTTAAMGTVLRHIRQLAGDAAPERTDRQLLDDFAARRDEAAFAALVARHGAMVLRVCRRVLGHEQDAEDAFQATFLVLAASAVKIRQREAVAGFLHGVAQRIALKARRTAARRRRREEQARSPASAPSPGLLWEEVRTVLDEEVRRLTEPFRSAFVLCILEGKSGPEAAAVLGCKPATVYTRMNRARRLLQKALAARGIELASLLAALAVADGAARAAPAALVHTAARFGLLVAAGSPAAGVIPSHIAALAAGVTRAMFLSKTKIAAILMLAAGLLAAGAGVLSHRTAAAEQAKDPPPPAAKTPSGPPAAKAKPPAAEARDSLTFRGRVLGPDGQPVAGAKLYLTRQWASHHQLIKEPESATTGRDGCFAFTAPKGKYHGQVTAAAPNLGVGWTQLEAEDKRTDLTLKLVADDVPITGQVVDLQGKPIAGATLRLLQIMASPNEDLGPWLEAARDRTAPPQNRDLFIAQKHLPRSTTAPSAAVTTDAAGRFRLTGIGRERLAIVRLEGPTIASEDLHVRTRPGEAIQIGHVEAFPSVSPRMDVTYYGADFRHVARPTKPVVGVVRDKDTKKPLAGVTVRSEKLATNPVHGIHIVETITDTRGRYCLTGLPKGMGNKIAIVPPRHLPYVAPVLEVPDSIGLEPVTVDVELKRAVWIEGKLTDKATGKPLRGRVFYRAGFGNPNRPDYAGFLGGFEGVAETNEDGTYRIIGLPGPGMVYVFQDHQKDYLFGAERDDEDGLKEGFGDFAYIPLSNFAAFARIDPAKGSETVRRDITLVRGWTFTGTLLGPDGKPLTGAVMGGSSEEMKTAEFTVRRFNSRRPRPIFFRHPQKGLVGIAQPPREDGGSVTVRMGPGATVTGRVVDAGGEPQAGVELWVGFRPRGEPLWDHETLQRGIKTDREGRFRIDALLPGLDYYLATRQRLVRFGPELRAGETKDLGDVR